MSPFPRHPDVRVEGLVHELADDDPLDLDVGLAQHVAHQIVGHRAGGLDALERERYGGGLDGSDPDGQVPIAGRLLEEDYRLVGR